MIAPQWSECVAFNRKYDCCISICSSGLFKLELNSYISCKLSDWMSSRDLVSVSVTRLVPGLKGGLELTRCLVPYLRKTCWPY